jgi:hypothetical protein
MALAKPDNAESKSDNGAVAAGPPVERLSDDG